MKKYPLYLYILIALVLALGVAATAASKVIPNNVDKTVHNTPQNEQPTPTPTVQADPIPEADHGKGAGWGAYDIPATNRKDNATQPPAQDPCSRSKEEAEKSGWKILSCDPLRVMPLEEWKTKSASANHQYRPELYCFDESNFAGVFKEQLGEMVDGYYPEWLSEMKLENGCSFFFHPTQGRENAPLDPADARG